LFGMKLTERPELGRLTTFECNRNLPVHRWLRYKEAFSRDLALILIDELGAGGPVLDPFCGSGTTLLACRERGLASFGADVNPIALAASRAKTSDYTTERIAADMKSVFSERFERGKETKLTEDAAQVKRFFARDTLERVLFFRSLASSAFYRDFFLLALANAAYECSRAVRDGAVLKLAKKRFIPLAAAFKRNAKSMERDLKKAKFTAVASTVLEADARALPLAARAVSAVVTSPPYLGIEDYTKAYAIENFAVGGSLKPWLGAAPPSSTPEEKVQAYFSDMASVLAEMKRVCMPSAGIAMVMWDGFVRGEIVGMCEAMVRLASVAGLRAEKAWIVNRKPALEGRTRKAGELRESIIFLRVPA